MHSDRTKQSLEETMTASVRKTTMVNKNAKAKLCQEQRTDARDKTHEQRKPKKKRKKIGEDTYSESSEQNTGALVKQTSLENNKNSEFHRSKRDHKSYLSNKWIILERTKTVKAFEKILQPGQEQTSISVIRPVLQMQVTCYPLTGASYSNPLVPREEISFPTQVSEQLESNTDELVFSSGRSFKVERDTRNQTPGEQIGAGFGSYSRQLDQHQTQPRNYNQNNYARQHMQKRPPRPPRHPEYRDYDQRRMSFARWWKQCPDPSTLCNAGFFFTNKGDLVRCYHCGIGLKDFSYGDNPLHEHVKHSCDCLYLKEYLGQEALADIKSLVQPENQEQQNSQKPSSTSVAEYRHPEYKSYHVRLSSFSRWPRSLMQRPEQLAEAGLYYTGFEDNVRCFACDGGLRKWDPEDDPWIEHCRWFPECPFVRDQKGDEYIGLVQATTAMKIQERLGKEETQTNKTTGNELTAEMERLTLKDPELNAVINEHREACLEMGYQENDFNIAAKKLAQKGNVRPTLEDILDAIEAAAQIDSQSELLKNETPIEENIRLKSLLFCMTCRVNAVNALFFPCTHHRMCMACAEPLTQCPVCDRYIRQKIKTYLV